ncbi:MAG TPA: TraR/DksA C4-type zinc finger protein [Trebonia sp.]|jgi:RNA polymerase-binding transcription factor DksA|nr:TraR/DksA C4-type zinc finger protein [Trebonia sp.]
MHRDDNPRWRVILEDRWRDRLQQVTELSLAYHGATAQAQGGLRDAGARRLLSQAVAARRRLADTEEALGRLATGDFGHCEQCQAPISELLLAAAPEIRYCGDCVAAVGVTVEGTITGPLADRVPAQPVAAARS